jgi:NAD(P)-dependent dehydrogenase (short-subunit alcohol dehydrogenase family)
MVNMSSEPKYTKEGFEITWAASYFGHFLLTELLLDTLKSTQGARWGIVSSVVHAGNPKNRPAIHLEDLHYKSRKYSNFGSYGEAKLAAVLYALELGDRLKDSGVFFASIHPGWARSNFGSGGPAWMRAIMGLARPLTKGMSDSNEDSAQTSLHVLLSDDAPNHQGAYFSQHSVLYRDPECKKGGWPMKSPNPNAHDLDMAKKLVEESYKLVGLK